MIPEWYTRQMDLILILEIHYNDVLMTTMASQITSLTVVYSTVYSAADKKKHQSSTSLAFVWGIHRDRWIPRTKGQLRGKCFHLMTSSCQVVFGTVTTVYIFWWKNKRNMCCFKVSNFLYQKLSHSMSLIIKYSITKNVDIVWTWTKQYYALIVMAKFKTDGYIWSQGFDRYGSFFISWQ